MAWLDLTAGIVEEFAGRQGAYVNATAIQAGAFAPRVEWLREYRRRWRDRNRAYLRAMWHARYSSAARRRVAA